MGRGSCPGAGDAVDAAAEGGHEGALPEDEAAGVGAAVDVVVDDGQEQGG